MNQCAAIFDIDGVLVDTANMVEAGRTAVIDEIVGPSDESRLRIEGLWSNLAVLINGGISLTFMHALRHECRLADITAPESDRLLSAYLSGYWSSELSVEGAEALLDMLQRSGVALAVCSNGRKEEQTEKLRRSGLASYFEKDLVKIASTSSLHAKPSPDMLSELASALGLPPSRCFYIGDRGTDVISANLAGIVSVALKSSTPHPNATKALRRAWVEAESALGVATPRFSVDSLAQVARVIQSCGHMGAWRPRV